MVYLIILEVVITASRDKERELKDSGWISIEDGRVLFMKDHHQDIGMSE